MQLFRLCSHIASAGSSTSFWASAVRHEDELGSFLKPSKIPFSGFGKGSQRSMQRRKLNIQLDGKSSCDSNRLANAIVDIATLLARVSESKSTRVPMQNAERKSSIFNSD
jgi:hypothetical protein